MSIAISGSTITFADLTTQSSAAVSGGAFKNRIINGDFRIWQRGTSIADSTTTSNFYTADRWGFNRAGDATGTTVSRQASGLTGYQYALSWQRTAGNSNTGIMALWNSNESANTFDIAGQVVTLSFWAKTGANYSGGPLTVNIRSGTGIDQRVYLYTGFNDFATTTFTLSSTWTLYSISGTVPTSATELGSFMQWTPTGTAGADDSILITGVQLERGGSASDFEIRPIGSELALCQRYYLRKSAGAVGGIAIAGGGIFTNAQQDFPDAYATMRIAPLASASAASDFTIAVGGTTRAATSLAPSYTGTTSTYWTTANNSLGQTAYCTLYASSAGAYLQYNAEL